MGLISTLGSLLIFIGLYWICTGFEQENCTNYKTQFERVFSVPGDMAMLNSTLVSPDVFDITTVPYSITWYDSRTSHEMSNQTGRTLVHGETLWFLNATPEDSGEYVTILRTPFHCYMQATSLVVEPPIAGECGRPRKVDQSLTLGVADTLSCPLKDYINKLDSYNISSSLTWYRGCEPIVEGKDEYSYRDRTKISIKKVEAQHNSTHTCTLTFTLGGITGSVSETIKAEVTDVYSMVPQVHEPANEIIKAQMGSNFTKRCRVFVPGIGVHFIDVIWSSRDYIFSTDPSDRVYTSEQRSSIQRSPKPGLWLERLLTVSELREEDFQINYTCIVFSSRGMPMGYFTLLPADPNIIVPIGSMFGGVTVLFIICVIIYYLFKVDIVLWFRRVFPVLYTNTDLDGKLYDAYVAYPPPGAIGFTEKVETFALHTLPQVLEKACDYKLFIAGRDCQPGQAIVDSVEENIQASRRLLLLYTASTFASKRHTSSTSSNNNNNLSKNINSKDNSESKTGDNSSSKSFDGSDEVYPDTRQQLECVAAMHRVLLEGSLKVVLVELEEITPAQLALFPESVRHLRKKQGAVRWWKNLRTRQRRRTCMRRREDEETGEQDTQLSPSLSPSSKFWKEMRYYMPVRGKRAVYPEKTALLNMKGL
ncbi:interleukin-1 receptor type 1-like [Seriola aureovittata]|uniref:interleukin-1 receptor type 1-like n=1 Tax=Seriola aureovittata TaxID=2871759 RepID=UPI0024BDF872|nr:interleukin-1 receptor type 1-like [Seriola aureovittata]XP_056246051.1 interleukin-1 receptor type 1-like [Seriola aureovittata]XP_056246052.1 interleukin-1 receptor type 1-like [Seriola aureovittata]XP_056246053.1 interleukin-1 receptor type 1-like [Seriola aureovittata]